MENNLKLLVSFAMVLKVHRRKVFIKRIPCNRGLCPDALTTIDHLKQDYVIRLKSNRKLLYHNKWTTATELRNRRKGKVKADVFYKGKEHTAYLSHVKVQITASRKNIYLVLVYGITENPMTLATNKAIRSKDDVIRIDRTYFSRWRIEEYFRCKKADLSV